MCLKCPELGLTNAFERNSKFTPSGNALNTFKVKFGLGFGFCENPDSTADADAAADDAATSMARNVNGAGIGTGIGTCAAGAADAWL